MGVLFKRHLTLAVTLLALIGCGVENEQSRPDALAAGSTPEAQAAESSADKLAGDWTLSIDTPRGVQHPVLSIAATDGGYTATYSGRQGLLTIDEVALDGDRFAFPLSITVPIGTIEVSYEGVVSGNTMTGVVKNPRGEVPFSGERAAP